MQKELIQAIAEANFSAILQITATLSDTERLATIDMLKKLDLYAEKDFPRKNIEAKDTYSHNYKVSQAYYYALITMVRQESDIAKVLIDRKNYYGEPYQENPYMLFRSRYIEPVIAYYQLFPPDSYIPKVLKKIYTKEVNGLSFGFQWYCYKKGWIPFDEERFVKTLLEVDQLDHRSVTADTNFLLQNPDAVEKVLLQLYRIETKVLDLSKWESDDTLRKTNSLGSAKITTYWDEVFELLVYHGYQIPRSFVGHLLESLLNQWKKPHLDWHCRLLKWLAPTHEELLAHQQTLFAVLGTGVGSVVKSVMEYIASITNAPQFDFEGFMQQFPLAFTVEKQPKSLLLGIDILAKEFKKHAPTDLSYRDQLAVLFTQPDAKLQEQTASLLLTYFNDENLAEVVAPYRDYLKGKAQELCQSFRTLTKSEFTDCPPSGGTGGIPPLEVVRDSGVCERGGGLPLTPKTYLLTPPTTWDTLLFLLGDCLREKTATTIDVFFDALVRLQDQIPADYAQQIAPYIKQLMAREWDEIATMPLLYLFLDSWCSPNSEILIYDTDKEWKEIKKLYKEEKYPQADKLDRIRVMHHSANEAQKTLPYLFHKIKHTLQKLDKKDTLPFLATPTHAPFYIEAETLVDKLLQYENAQQQPNIEDLIIACQRLLFKEASAVAKEKALKLKGGYVQAVQYFLGLTDEVKPTEALLPLWKVVARLRQPDETLVDAPYYIDYGWEKVKCANGEIDDVFQYKHGNREQNLVPRDADYWLSLAPQYPDPLLCPYISAWATMNEAQDIRNMSMPLEVLLRYDLRVRHSGWLYIGACLLFEKRPSRDLAYEYIVQAIARGENLTYLVDYLADALALNYLPITRFVEFLDRPNPPAIKQFGQEVVKRYLEVVSKQDKLPRNHKKMISQLEN